MPFAMKPPPTAVMIHGAGGGGWEYDKWRPVFERAGWKVVARDLMPASGGLAKTTLDDYVRQVESWCPKTGEFVLIGASMGGRIALEVATHLKPKGIVLVNSVPPEGMSGRTYPMVVKWANGPLKDTQDSMPDSDRQTILWAWPKWRNESGAVLKAISVGGKISRPSCPMIVVIGESDLDIPPAKSFAVARRFHAKVLKYKGMSHVGPLLSRRAGEVAQDVVKALDR